MTNEETIKKAVPHNGIKKNKVLTNKFTKKSTSLVHQNIMKHFDRK